MSYIVCAELYLDAEMNLGADIQKVDARILYEDKNRKRITFDVRGEFGKQQEITMKLCKTLIGAGFVEFEIRHSY
jgi:hypothetical protein